MFVVRAHGALLFALPVAFLLGIALVVRLLALGQANFHLHLVALPVEGHGDEGVALALDGADERVDLFPVQQHFARAAVVGHHVGGGADERRDRGADQEDFALDDHGVAVAEIDAAGAQRLHFPALQFKAGFEALVDVVLVACAFVQRNGTARVFVFVLRLGHVR